MGPLNKPAAVNPGQMRVFDVVGRYEIMLSNGKIVQKLRQ